MELWWHSLNLPLQIFYGTGLVAAVALGIEGLLTLIGFNHHDMPDAGVDHPDQMGMLSVRTITGFFFGFGWAGVIAIKSGLGLAASILIACVVGAAFLFGLYLLMRTLFSTPPARSIIKTPSARSRPSMSPSHPPAAAADRLRSSFKADSKPFPA